jgi:hypothetical protein
MIPVRLKIFGGRISAGLRSLGKQRDGLLLAAGALYLLGYLTWACYGATSEIGFIPVFDAQYFAAGIVPAIIIILFSLTLRLLRSFDAWRRQKPTPGQKKLANILYVVGIGGILAFVIVLGISSAAGWRPESWHVWLASAACVCLYLAAIWNRSEGDRFLQVIANFILWAYAFLVPLILLLFYLENIMPNLPPEWGGAAARCAELDVDSAQIAPETRQRIRANTASTAEKIVRTAAVYIIFDGAEYLFLAESNAKPSRNNRVYRLRKEVVKGIFPCPPENTASAVNVR